MIALFTNHRFVCQRMPEIIVTRHHHTDKTDLQDITIHHTNRRFVSRDVKVMLEDLYDNTIHHTNLLTSHTDKSPNITY